ncbi:DNA packaging protein UL33 [macacine betaherpesvirus 9]|uniref:DNA packaging protein UL33 n=1 Tax=macacine betaherpesvirus 9 TaxID=2560568 RepID=A0A191S3W5_9BETA|nr:DNA packaging protein UL33 [macacine betaherpesvirus 9]ANC96588.1 DNA packaging protein UL33 [macacine betaherpesvirus 9]
MSNDNKTEIELLYEKLSSQREFEIAFFPMLPRLYDIMLPSLDSRLQFINVGYKHLAYLKYLNHQRNSCTHSDVLRKKVKLLTAILSKLLNINGILDQQEYLNTD